MSTSPFPVGIDAMAAYVPELMLPVKTLAEARRIEYAKLSKGLGLKAMSMPDADEDAATLGATAVQRLLEQHGLDPRRIGRLYVGTESAFDGAKPLASYILGMLRDHYAPMFGGDCFRHCDATDLTFACIGAVDALQNSLDWVAGHPERQAIVVATDIARYELGSSGEYTQGAGAVALLVRQDPRLLAIEPHWGVATDAVYDFFKPRRRFAKSELIAQLQAVMKVNGVSPEQWLASMPEEHDFWVHPGEEVVVHRDQPVFDGPYSNACYRERLGQALDHFRLTGSQEDLFSWDRLVFHLPYAYQARRMATSLFAEACRRSGRLAALEAAAGPMPGEEGPEWTAWLKTVSKTAMYQAFIAEKIEPGERISSRVGNGYTASIFLALLSTLEAGHTEANLFEGGRFGFLAYGSGSKAKVFSARLQPGWQKALPADRLLDTLENRRVLDFPSYERLHQGRMKSPVEAGHGSFRLKAIERETGNRYGQRTYIWPSAPVEA